MFAIIRQGSKQQKVKLDHLCVIDGWHNVGEIISFENSYIFENDGFKRGQVTAEVLDNHKTKKIHIIKMKRRKHHIKRQGSRNLMSKILIKSMDINTTGMM